MSVFHEFPEAKGSKNHTLIGPEFRDAPHTHP